MSNPPPAEREALVTALFGPGGALARHLPNCETRPAQAIMARLVMEALDQKRPLVVEAGTGTGKTMGYLLPLAARRQQAIVSTATKALQDQIMDQDLPLLRRVVGRPLSAVALKGRSNYLCRYRLRLFQGAPVFANRDERHWFREVVEWTAATHTGDRDELGELPERLQFWPEVTTHGDQCLGQECPDSNDCFLLKARGRARDAELVVVNHYLYFADLAVRVGGFGEVLPKREVAVFDEAHQIPDVATRFFGVEVSTPQLRELARDVKRELALAGEEDPETLLTLERLERAAAWLRESFGDGDSREALTAHHLGQTPGQALTAVAEALTLVGEALAPQRTRGAGLAACFRRTDQLREDLTHLRLLNDPNRVYWYETRGRGVFLQASPLAVGTTLAEVLYPELRGAIFTSATLATSGSADAFRYTLGQLGLDPDQTLTHRLPTAFNHAQQALLYLPVHLPTPDAPAFAASVVEELVALVTASRGRAFCLFTSHRMLATVQRGLQGRVPYPLLVQGERPKRSLLDAFRAESSVLLGTGSFWEGVDVPGEALSLVVIDRLPFSSPGDPLVAARARHLEQQGHNAFAAFHLPRAVLALKQGLGRLLRRADDRGVMAVLDVRLTQRSYGRHFLEGLPPTPVCRTVAEVARFFSS